MMIRRLVILVLLLMLSACKPDEPDCQENPLDPACYVTYDETKGNLTWAEEFDYEGLPDPEVWNYDLGGGGWGNREIQVYTDSPRNAEVKDGMLHITARKDTSLGTPMYTSARLKTRYKADFLFGYIEIRAKLPDMLGPWSAIWMKGTHEVYGGWPKSGEIDIMEYARAKYPTLIKGTLHTEKYNHMTGTQRGKTVLVDDVTQFHTYAIAWEPKAIRFYVDDTLYHVERYSAVDEVNNWEAWPFDQQMYLLLNIAVGGSWGGDVIEIEDTAVMQVDWIRVWDWHIDLEDDDEAPEAPKDVTWQQSGDNVILKWRQSVDNVAIHHYDIRVDGVLVHSDFHVSASLDLASGQTYDVTITAVDHAGNESPPYTLDLTL
jgi:beta-glucanase (GH16 family)